MTLLTLKKAAERIEELEKSNNFLKAKVSEIDHIVNCWSQSHIGTHEAFVRISESIEAESSQEGINELDRR